MQTTYACIVKPNSVKLTLSNYDSLATSVLLAEKNCECINLCLMP